MKNHWRNLLALHDFDFFLLKLIFSGFFLLYFVFYLYKCTNSDSSRSTENKSKLFETYSNHIISMSEGVSVGDWRNLLDSIETQITIPNYVTLANLITCLDWNRWLVGKLNVQRCTFNCTASKRRQWKRYKR